MNGRDDVLIVPLHGRSAAEAAGFGCDCGFFTTDDADFTDIFSSIRVIREIRGSFLATAPCISIRDVLAKRPYPG